MEKGNGIDMMEVLSTNITSPLGMTTEENHQALKAGNSLLARYERWKGIPEPFTASLMTESPGGGKRLAIAVIMYKKKIFIKF